MQLREVKGIGPKAEKKLNDLGIFSIFDLLNYLPYTFKQYTLGVEDGRGTLKGVIVSKPLVHYIRKGLNSISFKMRSGDTVYNCTLFNRAFLKEHLRINREIYVTGTVKYLRVTAQEVSFSFEPVIPVYRLNDIPQKTFRNYIRNAISYRTNMPETLDEVLRLKYKLLSRADVIYVGHNPKSHEEVKQFYRRTKYEEFLKYQLEVKSNRKHRLDEGVTVRVDSNRLMSDIQNLPFTLTESQKQTLDECIRDLENPYAMNRLIQGDVGSGKTIVAMLLISLFAKDGYQSALMAPTEILAKQHQETLSKLFPTLKSVLLTSSNRSKDVLNSIQQGDVDVVIGTHALFQNKVSYKNLALVITDEQHRFGVDQRNALKQKGYHPHMLSLSATPIPRTLAITLFGDMDLSAIKEKPIGRKDILSKVVTLQDVNTLVSTVQQELNEGHQVFIVTSIIDESEVLKAKSLHDVKEWAESVFDARVEALHGRLKFDEKELVMRRYKEKEIDILISTTVIEVGVDVPNATVMIIFDSDRFGLSQLHQLRGRIGRGAKQSMCFFVHQSEGDLALKRLKTLEKTNDGFKIAEADLELRGPGEFLGSKQSGFPKFQYGNVFSDFRILEVASQDASEIVYNMNTSEYPLSKAYIDSIFGGRND